MASSMVGWLKNREGWDRAGLHPWAGGVLVIVVGVMHGFFLQKTAQYFDTLTPAPPLAPRIQAIYLRDLPSMLQPTQPPALSAAVAAPKVAAKRIKPPQKPSPRSAAAKPVSTRPTDNGVPTADDQASAIAELSSVDPAVLQPPPQVVGQDNTELGETPQTPSPSDKPKVPFDWPQAMRLKFALSGNYKGDIEGQAQVEWMREQDHYQVDLDVRVGLPFAPIMSRRMSSQGVITATGLMPDRYDQETKIAFSATTYAHVKMAAGMVEFSNGHRSVGWPGLQDSASQFVQWSWRLSTQPTLLKPGASIEMPLALPGRIIRSVYDIGEQEVLQTPFGPVSAWHLIPRPSARGAQSDLLVEMWLAPQYRYLPVRLLIRQDAKTFMDLNLARPPEEGSVVDAAQHSAEQLNP